jgi:hypothetical protein
MGVKHLAKGQNQTMRSDSELHLLPSCRSARVEVDGLDLGHL